MVKGGFGRAASEITSARSLTATLNAIKNAEIKRRGSPVYKLEAFQVWLEHEGPFIDKELCTISHFAQLCYQLYRNDEVLADPNLDMFSTDPKRQFMRIDDEGKQHNTDEAKAFELFSDRMERLYPKYDLSVSGAMMPRDKTPTVSFEWLKELLLSTDLRRLSELQFADEGNYRMLDGSILPAGERVAIASFMKSGKNVLT